MSRFSSAFFYFLYSLIFWPLLFVIFQISGVVNPKIKRGLQIRSRNHDGLRPWLGFEAGSKPIWIHCASFEFEYAKPVITRLKAARPDLKILVTYFSPTVKSAAERFPGVDFACPLPWDSAQEMRRFINHHQPQVLLIARTDAWPQMVRQARLAKLPTLLFSATFAAESGRMRGLGKWVSRFVLSQITEIHCVNEVDLKTLRSIGVQTQASIQGDTRYDQALARLESAKPIKDSLFQGIPRQSVFVAGSTWSEDEKVLIETISRLIGKIRFIIVPHEPTEAHLNELEANFKEAGLKTLRYSQAAIWPDQSIMIVDQLGILAELYQKGSFAFVGGSFKKTVHSVMEPLAAGSVTFVGPLHSNNREALEFKNLKALGDISMVQPVQNADEFSKILSKILPLHDDIRKTIIEAVRARSGKSESVLNWTFSRIDHK